MADRVGWTRCVRKGVLAPLYYSKFVRTLSEKNLAVGPIVYFGELTSRYAKASGTFMFLIFSCIWQGSGAVAITLS